MSNDLVEQWKNLALKGATEQQASAARPRLRVTLTTGFMLLIAMLGLSWHSMGLAAPGVLITVLLVHELPRASIARLLGRSSCVVLSEGGGSTAVSGARLTGKAALGFALLGSFANLCVAVTLLALLHSGLPPSAAPLLELMVAAHAVWGVAHLLPIVPFRAGAWLSSQLPESLRFPHAAASLAFLTVLALAALSQPKALPLLVLLVPGALAALRTLRTTRAEHHDHVIGAQALAARAETLVAEGHAPLAGRLAEQGLTAARSASCRARLWTCSAWAAIGDHDPFRAHRALGELPAQVVDIHLVASYLDCCNRTREAVELLEQARTAGDRSLATTKLLIELYFRQSNLQAISELARSESAILTAADKSAIDAALASKQE
jgi:hypothetical protein